MSESFKQSENNNLYLPDDFLVGSQTAPQTSDRWAEDARRKLHPSEVESYLVNALSGNLQDQQRLFATMADTWPRLQAHLRTLCNAVKSAPFTVHAFSEDGEEPTPEAAEQKDLVERAMWGTRPNVPRLEKSFEEILGAMAEADVTGHDVSEILWKRNHRGEIVPRAYRTVSAGWWGYPPAMRSLGADQQDRLMLRPGGPRSMVFEDFTPHKYLISIQPGHSGHPSVSATLRALCKYWIAAVYGVEWLLQYAQLFNVPFRWANYPANNPAAKAAVCSMLSNIGTAGWAAFPEGVKLNLQESTRASGDLPSSKLIDLADLACDILILGQTLTSDAGSEGGGSFALGKVHAGVKQDRLEAVAKAIAATLTGQLVPSIVQLNYGREMENYPEIRCDWPQTVDAKAEADRDKVLVDMGLPLPLAWLYERHGVPQPADGEPTLGANGTNGGNKNEPPVDAATAARVTAAKTAPLSDDLTDLYQALLEQAATVGWEELNLDETNPE